MYVLVDGLGQGLHPRHEAPILQVKRPHGSCQKKKKIAVVLLPEIYDKLSYALVDGSRIELGYILQY